MNDHENTEPISIKKKISTKISDAAYNLFSFWVDGKAIS